MPSVATTANEILPETKKPKRESGRPQPTFLSKTYEMINQADPEIGGWNQDGATFVVKDPKRFATEIIPKYFKHSNFSSFVRQLNFYGFHKLKNDSSVRSESELGWWQFKHEFFVRGNASLLNHIKRKTYADPATLVDKSEVSDLRRDVIELKDQIAELLDTVNVMKESLEVLHGERTALKSEVDNLRGALNKREHHDLSSVGKWETDGSFRKKQRVVKTESFEPKEVPMDVRPSFDVAFTPSAFSPSIFSPTSLGLTDFDRMPGSEELSTPAVAPTPLAFDRSVDEPDTELSGFMGELEFDIDDVDVSSTPSLVVDDEAKSKIAERPAVSWATAVAEMKEVVSQSTGSPACISSTGLPVTETLLNKQLPPAESESVASVEDSGSASSLSTSLPTDMSATPSPDLEACLSNIPRELQEKLAERLVAHLLSSVTPAMLASATARAVNMSSCLPNRGLIAQSNNLPPVASVC